MVKIDNLVNSFEASKQETLKVTKELLKYLAVKVYLGTTIALNLSTWLLARYIYTNIEQPRMALHYSVDFGIDLYGERKEIFTIPLLGLLFLLFNIFLLITITIYNKRDSRFLAHLMLSTVVIANIILLVAIFTTYLINFR